jgi:arylsulfatase A-like enzyme
MRRDPARRPCRALRLSVALSLAGLAGACDGNADGSLPSEPFSPPNIVFIVMDTARADHLSTHGWKRDTTPNLSRLAEDSVVYEGAHSTAPWTFPSHMSMFTGQLPARHGANWSTVDAGGSSTLDEIIRTQFAHPSPSRLLPAQLKEMGYATVGISNNPWVSARSGFGEGFDRLYAAWRRPKYPAVPDKKSAFPMDPMTADGRAGKSLKILDHHLSTDGLTDPFFLFFNFIDVHYPYLVPEDEALQFGGDAEQYEELRDPKRRKRAITLMAGVAEVDHEEIERFYDGSLRYLDRVIQQLIDWLVAEGRYDSTMIIVTSDHGDHLGENGRISHQLSVEEELLHVPLMIKYPGGVGAGHRESNPFVSTVDIYATILAAASNGEFTSDSESQDLSDIDRFDRPYSLAEYYFSNAYLNLFKEANPEFDVEEHQTVQRVVYTAGHKFVFADGSLLRSEPLASSGTGDPDPELGPRLTEWLNRYIEERLSEARPSTAGTSAEDLTADDEFLEALRELGYVDR